MERDTYQFTVEVGDIVMLPIGAVGIVTEVELHIGGCAKEVLVYPFTNWILRAILLFTLKLSFFDRDINRLRPLHRVEALR